jgi:hypothetical protein
MEPRPAEPVILDYARPERPAEVKAHWGICLWMMTGVVAFFAPLDRGMPAIVFLRESLGRFTHTPGLYSWQRVAIPMGLAMAIPMLVLAATLGRWPRVLRPVATASGILGVIALAGMILLSIDRLIGLWRLSISLRERSMDLIAVNIPLLGVTVLAIRALACRHGLFSVAWMTLVAPYLAANAVLVNVSFVHASPAYWLYLTSVPVVILHTIRIALHEPQTQI